MKIQHEEEGWNSHKTKQKSSLIILYFSHYMDSQEEDDKETLFFSLSISICIYV